MIAVGCTSHEETPPVEPGPSAGFTTQAERSHAPAKPPPSSLLTLQLTKNLEQELQTLVSIRTFRGEGVSEESFRESMERIREYLTSRVQAIDTQPKLTPFEWRAKKGKHWVFGYRLGTGPRKIAVICHLDTVPANDNEGWQPFEMRRETRTLGGRKVEYLEHLQQKTKTVGGRQMPFFVGRGAIDNKGPAVVALNVFKALALKFGRTTTLTDFTLELVFDTSEETGMGVPSYFKETGTPEMGFVFDANWAVVAEKGIARPVFTLPTMPTPTQGLWISKISTPKGATNQIPNIAVMTVTGDVGALNAFEQDVSRIYKNATFDVPGYRKAPITVKRFGHNELTIKATVSGAQHGSVPHLNRQHGYNPLVSLTNFADYLVRDHGFKRTTASTMAQFIATMWGTDVFGTRNGLEGHDSVFEEGNGTTYAVTRLYQEDDKVTLLVDVRYALAHHATPWDGKSQGTLPGKSRLPKLFGQKIDVFNAEHGAKITLEPKMRMLGPETRDPNSPAFQHMKQAYQAVMGEPCPMEAIGGGTDTKGHPELIAAGPIFRVPGADNMGPPINYHGLNEGVPIEWLHKSGEIYFRLLVGIVTGAPQ